MAKSNKLRSEIRKHANKALEAGKVAIQKIGAGIRFVWKHPIILSAVLLIAAYLLSSGIIANTFTRYMRCAYILPRLGMLPICDDYEIKPLGVHLWTFPGIKGLMDPPLEFVRKIVVWSIVIFFAFISLFLTITINNIMSVVRILVLNREEWRRFMAGIRTWLMIFVSLCLVFYYYTLVR